MKRGRRERGREEKYPTIYRRIKASFEPDIERAKDISFLLDKSK